MKAAWKSAVLALVALNTPVRSAIELSDIEDAAAVKKAAAAVAKDLTSYYTGMNPGDTPGNLPDPYYWWEAGGFFGTLVDYWYYTGDSTYNNITMQAIVHQAGSDGTFMPQNQTLTEGNDDQGFWALTVMNAAEQKFPDPPTDQPGWTASAQAVFNLYVTRWEPDICGGGLRWQIGSWMNGWDYKNTVANGCFFNIAARLGAYTGNSSYTDWADKIWDWVEGQGLITNDGEVYDGVNINDDQKTCGSPVKAEWSYNMGLYMNGAASMYAQTKNDTWKNRVDLLLGHASTKFVKDGNLYEPFCEYNDSCNNDQQSFKGYFARFLRATSLLATDTSDQILKILKSSAPTALSVCTGTNSNFRGTQGQACGYQWTKEGHFDGIVGVGEEMNVLSNLIYTLDAKTFATLKTGGTSKSNPNAGENAKNMTATYKTITQGDKAGAGILTALILMGLVGGCSFLIIDF